MALSMISLAPAAFVAPCAPLAGLHAPARVADDAKMVASSPVPRGADNFCYGLPGNFNAIGGTELNFDPFGFSDGADVLEMNRLRESELTHGRVGMLASAGFLVQEAFHPLFSADGGPAIEQIPKLPPGFLVALTMAITAIEAKRIALGWAPPTPNNLKAARRGGQSMTFQRLKDDYVPGDLGFDPLNLKPEDPTELRLMQEKELAHGRLGMIAAAGFLAQEAVSGATWGTWWGVPSL